VAKFNVGDVVRCIDDEMQTHGLVHGSLYTIQHVDSAYVKLNGIHDNGGFYLERFELVKPVDTPLKPFYNDYIILDTITRFWFAETS